MIWMVSLLVSQVDKIHISTSVSLKTLLLYFYKCAEMWSKSTVVSGKLGPSNTSSYFNK